MTMFDNPIRHNIIAHDNIAKKYNLRHSEVYNDLEQKRLSSIINKLVGKVNQKYISVLDFGAGTGNLTRKFLDAGCNVTACDVSKKSLSILEKSIPFSPNLKIKSFGGGKLPFKDNSFDIVAAYSVLHHIPDYLFALKEMIRVLKTRGFIYIDHEANENKWEPNPHLKKYYNLTRQTRIEHIKKLIKTRELFTFDFLKTIFIKAFINRRYRREGDIHVFKDDHIQWDKILQIMTDNNCRTIESSDYLLYLPKISVSLYNKFKNKCNDTKYIIGNKS